MSDRTQRVARWVPRVLAALYALFLGLFALDVWGMPGTFWERLGGFLIHLAPSYLVIALTAIAWKRPLTGGGLFLGLAVLFTVVFDWMSDWQTVVMLGAPLVVIGLLFLADGWLEHEQPDLQT